MANELIENIRAEHAETIRRLEAERDKAQNEATVYRNFLIPRLREKEAEPPAPPTTTPLQVKNPALQRRRKRGARFVNWFNEMRRSTNTPQQRTDALAQALENARDLAAHKSVEEKQHVSQTR